MKTIILFIFLDIKKYFKVHYGITFGHKQKSKKNYIND